MQATTHPTNWYGTWLWLAAAALVALALTVTIATAGVNRSWVPTSDASVSGSPITTALEINVAEPTTLDSVAAASYRAAR